MATINLIFFSIPLSAIVGFILTFIVPKKIKKIYFIEIFFSLITLLSSLYLLILVLSKNFSSIHFSIDIFKLNSNFDLIFNYQANKTEIYLIFLTALISFLVRLYSIEYLKNEERLKNYFVVLSLFVLSMYGIILSKNLFSLYIFWELVGFCSYYLIGFWRHKEAAANAAKKAFIVNRIGDIGFFLSILIFASTYKTLDLGNISNAIGKEIYPFSQKEFLFIALLLASLGAFAKSAQMPFYVWLPDAMEGPTPISALIHAATMVAAGVILISKLFAISTAEFLLIVAYIGTITALAASFIALSQNDIKKILAYSTISQLGYMFAALGFGAYSLALGHLIAHAFFKAGLFLSAGYIIHLFEGEQNIKKIFIDKKKEKILFFYFSIFSLSLCGFPFFSSFLTKDSILNFSLIFSIENNNYFFSASLFLASLLTSFYTFKLFFQIFFNKKEHNFLNHARHISSDNKTLYLAPIAIFAVLSLFYIFSSTPFDVNRSFVLNDITSELKLLAIHDFYYRHIDNTKGDFLNALDLNSLEFNQKYIRYHLLTTLLSLLMFSIGIVFAAILYIKNILKPEKIKKKLFFIYKLSEKKLYFDELYDIIFVDLTIYLSRFVAFIDKNIIDKTIEFVSYSTKIIALLAKYLDKYLIDGTLHLIAFIFEFLGLLIRKIQTGKVQTYIALSVLIMIIIYIFITN